MGKNPEGWWRRLERILGTKKVTVSLEKTQEKGKNSKTLERPRELLPLR